MFLALGKSTSHLPIHILGFSLYLPTTSYTLHVTLSNIFTSRHCLMIEVALGKKHQKTLEDHTSHQFNALQGKSIVMDGTSNNNLITEGQNQEAPRGFYNVEKWQIRSEINLN